MAAKRTAKAAAVSSKVKLPRSAKAIPAKQVAKAIPAKRIAKATPVKRAAKAKAIPKRRVMKAKGNEEIRNWIVISDTHSGCKAALCPPVVKLDEGGTYHPSGTQMKIYGMWRELWDEWVPEVTHGEPFGVIHNGDAIDGVHHGSTIQISHNLSDQVDIAYELLSPVVEACEGRYYHIRGTEAHVGKSGTEEERLAKRLGSIPNDEGQHARYDLWKDVGTGLVHLLHHVGTTGSQAYEATAVMKELTESFIEAARWGNQAPDLIVRCLSEDTELLTRDGWKGMNDVTIGDEVLTMHTLTDELQWQAATDKVINESEPEMIHMTGKGMDILVTPDHKMVLRSSVANRGKEGAWYLDSMENVMTPSKAYGKNGTCIELPVSGWYRGEPVPLTNAELWLLGFFMADGSFVRKPDGRRYAMRFHQQACRADEVESRLRDADIVDFTKTMNCEAGEAHFDHRKSRFIYTRKDCWTWYVNSGYAEKLMPFLLDDKTLTPSMMNMTQEQFYHLRDGFHYGDGAASESKLFNTNEKMLDQLQELMVKHGAKSNIRYQDYYTTKRNQKKRAGVLNYIPGKRAIMIGQKKKAHLMKRIPYAGKSWCVSVPNQTLVTRRNGCVVIVGNSHRHRCIKITIPTANTMAQAVVTPCWQGKTSFAWKIPGARLSIPQFGAVLIRCSDDGVLFTREKVWTVDRSRTE